MGVAFRPGTILLGKYRVESVLGREGMCLVIRATHVPAGDELALRLLVPETATSLTVHARFLREAQAAARLRGEHVARIVEIGVMPDGVPYMATEAAHGVDLDGELARRAPLAPGEAVDYALGVCEALAEAHAHGIVHRDLRPGNVFLIARPDRIPLVKVANFGISQTSAGASTPLARPDSVTGTPGYMAPEQRAGIEELDGRTDIWAVGVMVYECLAGVRPFPADARAAATSRPRPMDVRIPEGLQAIVLRCLETEREARFASVAELAAALAPFAYDPQAAAEVVARVNRMPEAVRAAAELPPAQAPPPVMPPSAGLAVSSRSRSRRRIATIAAVALAASIGGISAAVLSRPGRSRGRAGSSQARASLPARDAAASPSAASPVAHPGTATPAAANPATTGSGSSPSTAASPAVAPGAGSSATVSHGAPSPAPANQAAASSAAVTSAPASSAPVGPGDPEKRQELGRCAELEARRAWRPLDDCAAELAKLGASSEAEQLRATAQQELHNQLEDDQLQQALAAGNLKGARAALGQIGAGSVYLAGARDRFTRAEQERSDEVRQHAQALASAHDCAGLAHLVAQLSATATDRVVAAAQAVACEIQPPPERVAAVTSRPVPPGTDPRPAAAPGPATATTGPGPRSRGCDAVHVDDVMTRAAIQYDSGAAGSALSLARVALGCKQTDRMYWLAVMYACAAHDVAAAKLYFPKVPANLQAGIERKCQQDNLDVRTR